MNFLTFSSTFTNIFPAANSKFGGQLLSEFNLRSRESVATHSSIKYDSGLSYTHSLDDFEVRVQSDDSGVPISFSTIEVLPGVGVINGHFVQTLSNMTVDMLEANAKLQEQARPPLKGKLAIGIRIFYATEQTVAGSIIVENTDNYYGGVQLVILPQDELITPIESPDDISKVTAHLRLATFTFSNNKITNITNSSDKIRFLSADRIANIDQMLSDTYVRKTGLNSKKLYVFAGKGTDPSTGYDTWEDATDSLIVWDANPTRTLERPVLPQATFVATPNSVYLALPHRQVDGMNDGQGHDEFYAPRLIDLPVASYGGSTAGIVNSQYTQYIKTLYNEVNEFRTTLTGKQILYLETKTDETVLPVINPAWSDGDYILVNQDYSVETISTAERAPSTMYVVLPGEVTAIVFKQRVNNSDIVPSSIHGACLGRIDLNAANGDSEPNTSDPSLYPRFFVYGDGTRGVIDDDYFLATFTSGNDISYFYYTVSAATARAYSDAVFVTGAIPLAQESIIGGFLNIPQDDVDQGYVYRDEYGHLKLLDYELLRSGTLAYQLGSDLTLPSGLVSEEVQVYLDEYVNNRVAFPASKVTVLDPPVINIYLSLSAEETAQTVNIVGIDSRFETAVYLHILGDSNSNTTLNIIDCEKIRIDNNISGSPVINVVRSNLYYDPYIFNYVRQSQQSESFTGFQDIKPWYIQYDADLDPNLVVDGMTVSELDAPVIPTDISYWDVSEANDNKYLVALNSITFDGSGTIVRCRLAVANDSTDNVDPGEKIIVGTFTLPQGSGLTYPVSCLNKQLKVDGTFVSAYYADNVWYTTNTSFSAITDSYDAYSTAQTGTGNIAFHSITTLVSANIGATSIPAWETDTYHLFDGGCVS